MLRCWEAQAGGRPVCQVHSCNNQTSDWASVAGKQAERRPGRWRACARVGIQSFHLAAACPAFLPSPCISFCVCRMEVRRGPTSWFGPEEMGVKGIPWFKAKCEGAQRQTGCWSLERVPLEASESPSVKKQQL